MLKGAAGGPASPVAHHGDHTRRTDEPSLVVQIAELRPTVFRAVVLLLETVIVPTVLLLSLLHTVGLVVALAATLGWLYLALAARFMSRRRLPGTLCVCVGMMSGRAMIALLTSSAVVYVIQPAVGSVCMALLFFGSVLVGRPLTMRLARDFVAIPTHILERRGVRRMFTQVALLWALSRAVDAGMSLGFLHLGLTAGLASRGFLSPLLTVITILVSIALGVRALRRDGIRFQIGAVAASAASAASAG